MNTVLDTVIPITSAGSGKSGTMEMGETEMEMERQNGTGNGDIIYRPYPDIRGIFCDVIEFHKASDA